MTYDTIDMGISMPTPIPSKTQAIDIPTRTASQPTSLYADYTDYGEVFFDDPFDYDVLNEMIKLERVPNRRDSGYETPSSPVEKLQQEEHHVKDAIPAMWATEHNVSHHGEYLNFGLSNGDLTSILQSTYPPIVIADDAAARYLPLLDQLHTTSQPPRTRCHYQAIMTMTPHGLRRQWDGVRLAKLP